IRIDKREDVVVGVNDFVVADESKSVPLLNIDADVERRQVERVRSVRASRNADTHRRAMEGVTAAASSGSNLVPAIVAAVEALATVGEIADAMRAGFGE